jgi:hypothetical protein
MDKNVTRTEVQIDWVGQLTPPHIVITPEPVYPVGEKSRHSTGSTRVADVYRPRNLSRSVKGVCDE